MKALFLTIMVAVNLLLYTNGIQAQTTQKESPKQDLNIISWMPGQESGTFREKRETVFLHPSIM